MLKYPYGHQTITQQKVFSQFWSHFQSSEVTPKSQCLSHPKPAWQCPNPPQGRARREADLGKWEIAPGTPSLGRGPISRRQWNGAWGQADARWRLPGQHKLLRPHPPPLQSGTRVRGGGGFTINKFIGG